MTAQNPSRNPSAAPASLSRRAFLDVAGAAALGISGNLLTRAGRAYPGEAGKKIRMAGAGGVHEPVQKIRAGKSGAWTVPQYWKSDMLPQFDS